MKVLQLCIRYPPAPGGAETHVSEISKELINRGYNVSVFTSDLYTEVPFKKLSENVEKIDHVVVKRFKSYSLGGEAHYVLMPGMVIPILTERCALLHAHSYGYWHTTLAAFAQKFRKMPLVLTPHFHPYWSMWDGTRRKKLRRIYDKFIGKRIVEAADVVICVSKHELALLREIVSPERVRIIPNGVDFSRFKELKSGEKFRSRYGIDGELVLFTGRLASNKGLPILVDAIPKVLREFPQTIFALVGEDQGVKATLIKQAETLDISHNILFTGHISEELLLSAYTACDVFVLPSEYEAFGIVLLEAMASAKPCIGTRVGGIPEVIEEGKTGLLVEYKDEEQLTNAIIRLLSDNKKSRKMGIAGREMVKKKFRWEKIVDRLEEVYRLIS